jgi:lipopolysaccharide/colanic/teichoic acid biosynthesis glycosyltransferase
MFKFATMIKDSLNIGSRSITLRDDPRVTSVGKYLRLTKVNELPQLINVLLGDMSLVGPRPFVDETFNTYSAEIQKRVYQIKPGLTGIGSIVFRDEEGLLSAAPVAPHKFYANVISPYKGQLEMWYQQHASLWLDMKIVMYTAVAVILPSASWLFRAFPDLPTPEDAALRSHLALPARLGEAAPAKAA